MSRSKDPDRYEQDLHNLLFSFSDSPFCELFLPFQTRKELNTYRMNFQSFRGAIMDAHENGEKPENPDPKKYYLTGDAAVRERIYLAARQLSTELNENPLGLRFFNKTKTGAVERMQRAVATALQETGTTYIAEHQKELAEAVNAHDAKKKYWQRDLQGIYDDTYSKMPDCPLSYEVFRDLWLLEKVPGYFDLKLF